MIKYNNHVITDLTEEQLNFLINSWSTLSNEELSTELGISKKRVSQVAKIVELPHKKLVYKSKVGIYVGGKLFKSLTQEKLDYILSHKDCSCVDISREISIDSRRVSEILLLSEIRSKKYINIEETDEFLADMHDTTITNIELSKKYSVTPSAIGSRRRAMGIMFSPIKLPKTSGVELDLKDPYKSHVELARKYGVTETTISRRRKELGINVKIKNYNTLPELVVGEALDELDYVYTQQKHIDRWSIDFYLGRKVCIDVNGEWAHSKPEVIDRDKRKSEFLRQEGYKYLVIHEKDTISKDIVKDIINTFMLGSTV